MSTLRDGVNDYLALRRALGFKLRVAGAALLDFVSFLERADASYITTELALDWATASEHTQPAQWTNRLSFVRGFARYWSATDPRTEVPPEGLLPHRYQRCRPYIYTDEEILALLHAAQSLQPTNGLRPWTYYYLFGLLSVTGLRISEGIALQRNDVNLQEGLLTVRDTKFGKSRMVPLHASSRAALLEYGRQRDTLIRNSSSSSFFVSDFGQALKDCTVRWTFIKLSRQIGLRGKSDSFGPRLHDLRHRFAINTLVQWYQAGEEVERRLPILSTYLGHSHIADTYWYLSACPELLRLAVERLERRWER